jgi:hypothetical protein
MVNSWFWRTYDQKEIDFVEESGGQFQGFEFKWGGGRKIRSANAFKALYPESALTLIDRDALWTFAGVP